MQKATQTPQGNGSSGVQTTPENQPELSQVTGAQGPGTPATDKDKPKPKPGKPRESKVHRLSQGAELYTPKKQERKKPALLTVEQYLRKARQDEGVSDLIRSLHRTKVMSFAEWERETSALLKKKTW